ncbi:MAG: hypothetical protein WCG47_21560 [Dermatophilaceae bacterium]
MSAWMQAEDIPGRRIPGPHPGQRQPGSCARRPEQIASYVAPMVEGRFAGTMCMSETDVASSLADMTISARRQHDGSYRVSEPTTVVASTT